MSEEHQYVEQILGFFGSFLYLSYMSSFSSKIRTKIYISCMSSLSSNFRFLKIYWRRRQKKKIRLWRQKVVLFKFKVVFFELTSPRHVDLYVFFRKNVQFLVFFGSKINIITPPTWLHSILHEFTLLQFYIYPT